jgi:hypothetical protein
MLYIYINKKIRKKSTHVQIYTMLKLLLVILLLLLIYIII